MAGHQPKLSGSCKKAYMYKISDSLQKHKKLGV